MKDEDPDKIIADFSTWLERRHAGEVISDVLMQEASRAYIAYRSPRPGRERRRDFVSRLMVCGFAHLLRQTGHAAEPGYIGRGFIPVFVQAFSHIAEIRLSPDLQVRSKTLLEKSEDAGIDDHEAWSFLLESSSSREAFTRLLGEVLHGTCRTKALMDEVHEAISSLSPAGIDGIYDHEDVYLIFVSWLEFGRRILPASSSGENTLTSADCDRALQEISAATREAYRDVADLYLEDIDLLQQTRSHEQPDTQVC